ncbi:MAG: aminoacyl-tRNA hydrolase [Gammaproteobacteria bacterium CG22_combo_CG10-13_8_21_14_all_40_8]|nr:MAG: aminoacyl-tRNA hydrolase [Gammaproteobacteria bacterium CG22_combo_CG10-13_8_21_14_all_40_8]
MPIKLIVGLANPGSEYQDTRHNAGAWYVEELARSYNFSLDPDKNFFGLSARRSIANQDVRFLIPTTFMNLSGKSVQALANFFKIQANEILVAHDELDLPCGTARLKLGGGHGGHNGLKSIIQSMGNNREFYRLRIGIDHPGNKDLVTAHVLSKPSVSQKQNIMAVIDEAVATTEDVINNHWDKAQNRLHGFKP